MEEFFKWIGNNISSCVAILAMLGITIEVIPIKISPLRWLGQRMNKPLEEKVDNLEGKMKDIDENQCKNFLVRFLADVERGKDLDEVEVERAYNAYEHYFKDLKCNSYIHDKWNRLMKDRGEEK